MFIVKKDTNFLLVKLTNKGREKLAQGSLNFSKVVLSDKETFYNIESNYDTTKQMILRPLDIPDKSYYKSSNNSPQNFDGSTFYEITQTNLAVEKIEIPSSDLNFGFFQDTNQRILNQQFIYIQGTEESYFVNQYIKQTKTLETIGNLNLPTKFFVFAPRTTRFLPIPNNIYTLSQLPHVTMFFQGEQTSNNTITIDRNLLLTSQQIYPFRVYYYNNNEIFSANGYGNNPNTIPLLWNLSIVYFKVPIGFNDYDISSIESTKWAGILKKLKLDNYPHVAILHYTNRSEKNVLGDTLIPNKTKITIPTIMWDYKSTNTASETTWGITLSDEYEEPYYDQETNSYYTKLFALKNNTEKFEVGRVYYNHKIIIIYDPEMVVALTYLSNRNYTLPEISLEYHYDQNNPNNGFLKENCYYIVTYYIESLPTQHDNNYGEFVSFPCYYLKVIKGEKNDQGNNPSLKIKMPKSGFIYSRISGNDIQQSYEGSGYTFNKIRFLIQEIPENLYKGLYSYKHNEFREIIDSSVYQNIETPNLNPINANLLEGMEFIINKNHFLNSTIYTLDKNKFGNTYGNNLKFGEEKFFFGNIITKSKTEVFRTKIYVSVKHEELNNSLNNNFSTNNENTYITEFYILDNENNIVAHAKPSYPIKKNELRFLTFIIQIDF